MRRESSGRREEPGVSQDGSMVRRRSSREKRERTSTRESRKEPGQGRQVCVMGFMMAIVMVLCEGTGSKLCLLHTAEYLL